MITAHGEENNLFILARFWISRKNRARQRFIFSFTFLYLLLNYVFPPERITNLEAVQAIEDPDRARDAKNRSIRC